MNFAYGKIKQMCNTAKMWKIENDGTDIVQVTSSAEKTAIVNKAWPFGNAYDISVDKDKNQLNFNRYNWALKAHSSGLLLSRGSTTRYTWQGLSNVNFGHPFGINNDMFRIGNWWIISDQTKKNLNIVLGSHATKVYELDSTKTSSFTTKTSSTTYYQNLIFSKSNEFQDKAGKDGKKIYGGKDRVYASNSPICYSAAHAGMDLSKPFFVGVRRNSRSYQAAIVDGNYIKSSSISSRPPNGKEYILTQHERGCFPASDVSYESKGCQFDRSRSDNPCYHLSCYGNPSSLDCQKYRYE